MKKFSLKSACTGFLVGAIFFSVIPVLAETIVEKATICLGMNGQINGLPGAPSEKGDYFWDGSKFEVKTAETSFEVKAEIECYEGSVLLFSEKPVQKVGDSGNMFDTGVFQKRVFLVDAVWFINMPRTP
ncbi:MAG: hypothetical protein LBS62_08750 [Clostridiales bacterium]|jgi:hypothetical protein|nr:hypothetical protein [Clostridiales bacterium]